MVVIRSPNEIISNLIDYFKVAQPNLSINAGSVARDLFIDAPSAQIGLLYDQLAEVINKASLQLVVGTDLDKLGKNYGVVRKSPTTSSGVALLTFTSINATININKNDSIIANNGFSFKVSNGVVVTPNSLNYYRSVASKYRDQLDFVGISDEYAVEVTVTASSAGTVGNVGKYSLVRTSIANVSNVTNINDFSGGTDQESDTTFRNRILSSFSGSSIGTALGYLNTALSVDGVSDAVVIEPGDPLMTRDGTVVTTAADGTKTIKSEGSGGKVDVVILGSSLIENTDSYIYLDKSNNNDPTSSKNDVVLGQIVGDANKTINRKRIDDIANGVLPEQPVESLLSVTGSISGGNFQEKSVDSYGRVTGNYELIKDTGVYGGCPWGFDKFHWISNYISGFGEDLIKGQIYGQDATTFSDVLEIPKVTQSISITNENSSITSSRNIIQLLHTPATNVTKVINTTTGERYLVTDQNLDQTSPYNQTGRIKISGNTLPTASDVLQVDYSWIIDYDQYSDYDGLKSTSNPRTVDDSVDWGYSSVIRNERVIFTKSSDGNFFTGTTAQPINTVISVKSFTEVNGSVYQISTGLYAGRLAIALTNLSYATKSIDSILLKNTNEELYSTSQNNGLFTTVASLVGITIYYNTTIILPTDTSALAGDSVSVILDCVTVTGSGAGTTITIPSTSIIANTTIVLLTTYIAQITDLLSTAITSIPASRCANGFLFNNNGFTNFSPVNISRRESLSVQKNLSLQYYVELNLLATEFTIGNVLTVVRLSDGYELWNSNNVGTTNTGISGNIQLILTGAGTPAINDRVLVVYYAYDIRRFQPVSYSNTVIKKRIDQLSYDSYGHLSVLLNSFVNQASGLTFNIIEPNTDVILYAITDGYLSSGTVSSPTVNFALIPNLLNKRIQIFGATNANNNGTYDVTSYDMATNKITITNIFTNITNDQVSIIRLLDGKEVWNYSGTIDHVQNRLVLPSTATAKVNEFVYVVIYNYKSLRTSAQKLIVTTIDQTVNSGILNISGTTFTKSADVIFTATNNGLKLNMSEAIRKALNLSSVATIPTNVRLTKVVKLEKVSTVSANSEEVLTVLTTYDVKNTKINSNTMYDDVLTDDTLTSFEFILPSTTNNTLNTTTVNLPKIGDRLRITFYYATDNDSESLSFVKNGSLYGNKKFALINRFYVSSGFKASQATRVALSSFSQPSLGSRYTVTYNYTAPKQNERIYIKYNYNKLIADTTFAIENARPINADVIVRSAKEVLLDLTLNIVISNDYLTSSISIVQSVKDKLITAMTFITMGTIVDTVTLINTAQSVTGVARARVIYFNRTGVVGQVINVQAQEDEYLAPNTIIVNTETY